MNGNKLVQKVFLNKWWPYVWLAIIGSALYYQSLFYDYTFDDYRLIVANYHYVGNIKNIFLAFARNPYWQNITPYYRPVLTLSFMADALIGGSKPFIYHLTNIILHIAACGALFHLLLRLGYKRAKSFAATLLFCLHPVLVQAVAWIPGRNDSLVTLFSLMSFGFLVEHNDRSGIRSYLGHAVFLLLALFTKETSVLLPFLFALYIFYIRPDKTGLKKTVPLCLTWAAGILFYLAARYWVIGFADVQMNTWPENVLGLISYLGKAFLPFNLSVMPVFRNITPAYGIAALILLSVICVKCKIANARMFFYGGIWFLVLLLPTIVRIADRAVFLEHRLYLPMVGLWLMVMEIGKRQNIRVSKTSPVLVLLIAAVFAVLTLKQSSNFKNSLAFWENGAKTSPDYYFTHYMLGNIYLGNNNLDKAENEYLKAISLNPASGNVHARMSDLCLIRGDSATAEKFLFSAIKADPANPMAYNEYGIYLLKRNDLMEAERQFIKASSLITQKTTKENQSVIAYNRGIVMLNKYLLDEALAAFKKASQLDPLDARAFHQMGVVEYNRNNLIEAGFHFRRANKLDPLMGESHDYLGMVYMKEGNIAGAINEIKKAREAMPRDPVIYEHLSFIYYNDLQYKEAVSYYDSAVVYGLIPDPAVLKILKQYR